MIVVVASVASDQAAGIAVRARWILRIVHSSSNSASNILLSFTINCCQRDDTLRARQNILRVNAFWCVAFQIGHFTVAPLCQPLPKLGFRFRCMSRGETTIIEPQFSRPLPNGLFHLWTD